MDSSELKALFLQRVSLGGNELEAMSQAFSALYRSFQTDVVTRVRCSPVEGKPYTWIDPPLGRSNAVSLFLHGGGYTMGSTDDHLQLISSLVEGSGISVLGVD
jgi:acetyl esterase/lipase